VWLKNRRAAKSNVLVDTVRGMNLVYSNTAGAQISNSSNVSSFKANGFSVGNAAEANMNQSTYASWNFQTTHRRSGTTNHGKAYTCHYNPFTGFTMVKYEGSGLAGHEIPHHLGRKLELSHVKNLSVVDGWYTGVSSLGTEGLQLNTTGAKNSVTNYQVFGDTNTTLNSSGGINTSAKQYIMYGWANSYYDEANTLIGNYYTYVDGNGILRMNVHTGLSRDNVLWQMSKTTLTTGDWAIVDFTRGNTNELKANLPAAERAITANALVSTASPAVYPRATDTSNLNLNATIPFANGIDASGTKNTILTKNETVSGLTFTQGKNYVYSKNDGTYGVSAFAPRYGTYNGFGDYFDVNKNQWYQSPSVFSDTMDTTVNWTAYASILSSTNGMLKIDGSGVNLYPVASLLLNTTIGHKYRLYYKWSSGTQTNNYIFVGSVSGNRGNGGNNYYDFSLVGSTYGYVDIVAPSTSLYVNLCGGSGNGYSYFDNVAIYPINNDGSVDTSSATPITESRNYLDAIVYADANGQPTYVEQLPKTVYFDEVKANEFKGKNACTAWVNFDGTTTPPTIRDSYNVKAVIRTATGVFDVYFDKPMDNVNYAGIGTIEDIDSVADNMSVTLQNTTKTVNSVRINTVYGGTPTLYNAKGCSMQFMGGKA
jgi:hypothetical protein